MYFTAYRIEAQENEKKIKWIIGEESGRVG